MTHRFYIFIIIIVCLIFPFQQMIVGQVTIGSNEAPVSGALLDLKQWAATSADPSTANKGLLLPRVSLKAANQLTPLYGGIDNGNGTWTDESTTQEKLSSTGIVVYNMNKDAIDIYSVGIYIWDGAKWVAARDNTGNYTIDCNTIKVNGGYKKNETLNATNTITMQLTVSSGGAYKITTDKINGISFEGGGALPAGTHTVTLKGTGTLTISYPFDININAKTANGNVTCTATVPVTYPDMTYAVIGTSSVYSWGGSPRKNLLDASTQPGGSFSPTGKVRVGLLSLWNSTIYYSGNMAALKTALGWAYFNTNGILDPSITYPDVILYYSYGADADQQLARLLSAYVSAGGGILFGSQDYSYGPVNIMMEQIFGLSNVAEKQIGGADDDVYPIINLPNDPIVNGPFGDLSGTYWGEDNATAGSIVLTQIPTGSVQICTAQSEMKPGVPLTNSIVWYNNAKNFVYIGDSTGAAINSTDQGGYPASYSQSGSVYFPQNKLYGPGGYKKQVYNAALELNALAWLLQKAAVSGINPH